MKLNSVFRLVFVVAAVVFWICAGPASAQNEPYRIGALFSLTGFGASAGTGDLNGVILAKEEINARGGVNGHPIEIVAEDNRSDLKSAVSGFVKLASLDKVPAVVGPNYSEFLQVVFPFAEKYGCPTVATSGYSSAAFVERSGPVSSFVLWPPFEAVLRPLSNEIIKREIKKVAMLVSENSYYRELETVMRRQLGAKGVEVETIDIKPGTTDFRTLIERIRSRGFQAVVPLLLETGELGSFFQQARALKLTLPVFGENHITDDAVLQKDYRVAEGAIFFRYPVYGSEEFKAKYRARFKIEPMFSSSKGYDALMLVAEAMKKCGPERQEIARCLRDSSYQGVSGFIRFDRRGVLSVEEGHTSLSTIRDGKIVPLGTN